MYIFEIMGLLFFVVLTVLGYRKSNRNILLMASICLLATFAIPDFICGFIEGYNGE